MSTGTTPVEFDPFSDDFFNDPTEMYRRLRDEAPVYFSEKYGFYALLPLRRRARRASGLGRLLERARHRAVHALQGSGGDRQRTGSIIMMDPPEHDRFRALVSRVFTPRAVDVARADDPRGHQRLPRSIATDARVRRRRRLRRALPRRGDLAHARRARGRAPADPPLARRQPRTARRARSRRAQRTSRRSSSRGCTSTS